MSRPTDWTPLADDDPFPGDPETVERAGKRYQDTAELIDSQAAQLRRLASYGTWEADAAEVFREHADKTADSIVRAHDRYAEVGGYLIEWSEVLDGAQRDSSRLLTSAKEAQGRVSNTATSLLDGVSEPTGALLDAGQARQNRHDAAVDEVAEIRRRLDTLRDQVSGVADRIAGNIRRASDDDVKDGFWDRVKGWISDHAGFLKAFADIMGWIATIAGVLALVLAMTGILAPLAALLTVVALVATAASLLANSALAVAGEQGWGAAIFDAVALLTFGVGRVAMAGAKAGLRLTQSAAFRVAITRATQAFRQANRSKIALADFASGFLRNSRVGLFRTLGSPIRWVGNWGNRVLNSQLQRQVDTALAPVFQLPNPTLFQKVRYLDSNIAGYATRARALRTQFPDEWVTRGADLTELWSDLATISIGGGVATDMTGKVATDNNPMELPDHFRTVTSPVSP